MNQNNKSNRCRTDCVDKGRNFCPSKNWKGGYCCSVSEKCPKPKEGICSEDNPKAPAFFKYLACPNEHECGNDKIITTKFGANTIVEVSADSTYKFNKGDVCSYIFEAPTGMAKWDRFYI